MDGHCLRPLDPIAATTRAEDRASGAQATYLAVPKDPHRSILPIGTLEASLPPRQDVRLSRRARPMTA